MDEADFMIGLMFEGDGNKLITRNPTMISFDMWCQCSAKNVRRIIKRNRSLKPIRLYLLNLVLEFCRLANIQPFVYGGTALSVYREDGKMIKHDCDIDLAVLERDEDGVGVFTKLLRTCIQHGVSYSGVSGEFPPFSVSDDSELTLSFDSRHTGKTWLHVSSTGVDSISEQFYDGRDCKIAKFYLSKTGLEKACDLFHKSANTLNHLMSDSCLAHVDLFTLSAHSLYPTSHLQVNWNLPGVYDISKKAFPIDCILPLKDDYFEGVCVKKPADIESYLKIEYGYLGRDAMFVAEKQLYVQIPAELQELVPDYMLDPPSAKDASKTNTEV